MNARQITTRLQDAVRVRRRLLTTPFASNSAHQMEIVTDTQTRRRDTDRIAPATAAIIGTGSTATNVRRILAVRTTVARVQGAMRDIQIVTLPAQRSRTAVTTPAVLLGTMPSAVCANVAMRGPAQTAVFAQSTQTPSMTARPAFPISTGTRDAAAYVQMH
jgi:hypothetical protein